jgi:GlpG protein
MRQTGTLPTEHQASVLTDWLIAEGIEAKYERELAGFEIWVKDEDKLSRARAEFEAYLADPQAAKYAESAARAAEVRRQRLEQQRQYERRIQRAPSALPMAQSTLTIAMIIASVVVGILTNLGHMPRGPSETMKALAFNSVSAKQSVELVQKYGADPDSWGLKFASVRKGELWRLVTTAFIHFGALHLIFNMIWLYQLGRMVESRYGTAFLGGLCLIIQAVSSFIQVAVPAAQGGASLSVLDPNLMIYLGGMSGVVYGLFGFIWVKAAIDPLSRFFLPTSTIVIMIGWMFFCMVSPTGMMSETAEGVRSSVANWSHGSGLAMGMLCAWLATISGWRR